MPTAISGTQSSLDTNIVPVAVPGWNRLWHIHLTWWVLQSEDRARQCAPNPEQKGRFDQIDLSDFMPRIRRYKWENKSVIFTCDLVLAKIQNQSTTGVKKIDSHLPPNPLSWMFCLAHCCFLSCRHSLKYALMTLGRYNLRHVIFPYLSFGLIFQPLGSLCVLYQKSFDWIT